MVSRRPATDPPGRGRKNLVMVMDRKPRRRVLARNGFAWRKGDDGYQLLAPQHALLQQNGSADPGTGPPLRRIAAPAIRYGPAAISYTIPYTTVALPDTIDLPGGGRFPAGSSCRYPPGRAASFPMWGFPTLPSSGVMTSQPPPSPGTPRACVILPHGGHDGSLPTLPFSALTGALPGGVGDQACDRVVRGANHLEWNPRDLRRSPFRSRVPEGETR